jgi:hypothetical protein
VNGYWTARLNLLAGIKPTPRVRDKPIKRSIDFYYVTGQYCDEIPSKLNSKGAYCELQEVLYPAQKVNYKNLIQFYFYCARLKNGL